MILSFLHGNLWKFQMVNLSPPLAALPARFLGIISAFPSKTFKSDFDQLDLQITCGKKHPPFEMPQI